MGQNNVITRQRINAFLRLCINNPLAIGMSHDLNISLQNQLGKLKIPKNQMNIITTYNNIIPIYIDKNITYYNLIPTYDKHNSNLHILKHHLE